MSIINKPSVNRPIPPVQTNSSFLQASINKVNNTVNNVLPKNVAKTVNSATKPINDSINSAVNSDYNAEGYTYIIITIGFLILTLTIVIYFRDQITAGFSMAWQKIKGLFNRNNAEDMPVMPPPPPPSKPMPDKRAVPVGSLMPEVGGLQTIEKSIESNVNKLIPKRKEVFNIAQDIYTYSDAEPLCKAYGAELATYDQVKEAWNKGADWCNYGWIKGQTAVYPTQKATYDKLQAGPEEQRGSCGVPGINGGYFDNPDLRFGVNCYGTRPDSNEADERYKAANRQNNTPEGMAYDKKVRDFKTRLNQIPVNPFKAGSLAL
jgi:Extracellular link domain